MFNIGLSFISGVMVGLEFYSEDDVHYLVIDLFIIRLVIGKFK